MDIVKRITAHAEKIGATVLFLQVPEGLKMQALTIARGLEQAGMDVVIGCDTVYGACDMRDREAKLMGCDALIHIGHSDFGVQCALPVVYEHYNIACDPVPLLERNIAKLEQYKRIAVLTTIQYEQALQPAKRFLERAGKDVFFARQTRNKKNGILLGCDQTAALPLSSIVDCFLYIGSGKFHPLGLAMKTEKPVMWLDSETGELKNVEAEKKIAEKVKAFHIAQARDSETFGILVSTKAGQLFIQRAEKVKRMLKEKGKQAFVLVMDEITPSKIAGMKIDILVNCACPRLVEDYSLFKRPILCPEDLRML